MPDIDPDLLAIRKQRAQALMAQADDAARTAKVLRHRRDNAADPFDDDDAVSDLEADAAQAEQHADFTANAAGLTDADKKALRRQMHKDQRDAKRGQLAEWKRLRKIHQDFIDNPDAYGGVDLGGQPLDPEAQQEAVRQYDAAISVLQAELDAQAPK